MSDYFNESMKRKRLKYLLLTHVLVSICLFTISSCEEEAEFFDNLEIKKETDDDKSHVEQPGISISGGN